MKEQKSKETKERGNRKNDGTNNEVAKRRERGNKETKKGRVIIIMTIIEIFIQDNPSIQKYCYQRGPTDFNQ